MLQPTEVRSEELLTPPVTSQRADIPELHVLALGEKKKEMKLALPESNFCILFTLADSGLRWDLPSDNRARREGRAEEWRKD